MGAECSQSGAVPYTADMSTPLLVTKLSIPPSRSKRVSRPRLSERLDQTLQRKLTLISAPAGFGKTTVIRDWVNRTNHPVAWLSLDEGDSDLSRFLTYLVAALQTVHPAISETVASLLRQRQSSPPEAILTALVNELSRLDRAVILVLDDYHLVDAPAVDDAIAFLLEHQPPRLHVVITTRQDPRLPLSRLRARDQMTEFRAADLRFTPDEATLFLREVMEIDVSFDDVIALETRTEGWIAGLQLAALSMQGRDDVSGFIQAFAGDNRYIVDYLLDEVLSRQADEVREFLLLTSILERFDSALCDAVTGRTDSKRLLEGLARGNLFVVALDETRRWYRYHHLFGDALHVRLIEESADRLPGLHGRASEWYERNGFLPEAIRHAFAADAVSRAADLVERSVAIMGRNRQETTLLSWMRALPDDVIRARPVLSVDYAGILLQALGDVDAAEIRLRDAEQWLQPGAAAGGMVVNDPDAFRRLPAQIAIYRAGQAQIRGNVADTMGHARRALDLLPEGDDFGRGAASGLLGLALWTTGELEAAFHMYGECMLRLERAGFIADLFGCALVLTDIRITQGQLHEAMRICERTLQIVTRHSSTLLRGTADMDVAMAGIHLEWNNLDAAIHFLQASSDLGDHKGLRQNPYRWRVVMARIRELQGDPDGALELLHEADRLYEGDFSPNVRPVPAMIARMCASHGKPGHALDWVRESGLTPEDELDYLHEFEHITLARILLERVRTMQGEHDDLQHVTRLLQRLLVAAEEGGRKGSVIEILVLQALVQDAHGSIPDAMEPLRRALELAEPEGYVRMFIGEGAPMHRLLTDALSRGITPAYTRQLLAAFDGSLNRSAHGPEPSTPPLADPLSDRELEVIRLVATGLSNQEIADRLYLALDTVKGHNRRIFAKLGVQRRTEAINRARELGLL
jgi:LuxR family maltose regulon positive regulatory protein